MKEHPPSLLRLYAGLAFRMHRFFLLKQLHVGAVLVMAALACAPAFAQPAINSLTGNPPRLVPNLIQVGSGPVTVTLKGSGFTSSSTAQLGSASLVTTYTDANTLTAIVPASLLKTIGNPGLTVIDSSGTSNSIRLTVVYRGD